MSGRKLQPWSIELWRLAERQHGVLSRAQLLRHGLSHDAIAHRLAIGRLHGVSRGVYAVGRPQLTRYGRWMAAILSCGPDAVLSHGSAAELWKIGTQRPGLIEVSVPARTLRRRPGILIHRRATLADADVTSRHRIPVTAPANTLIDIAADFSREQLERAINVADKRDLTDPDALRCALEVSPRRPGVVALRETLDRRTFTLTDSQLERRFLPIAREAGLPMPQAGRIVSGFSVDFYWPEIGLVVETDGLRYHRTPAQQARDRLRDQAHAAAGLTPLRFTHAQVRFEPDHVRATLVAVARRLWRAKPAR